MVSRSHNTLHSNGHWNGVERIGALIKRIPTAIEINLTMIVI